MDKTSIITKRIEGSENGSIFFVTDFTTDGNDKYISRVLSQDMVAKGLLMKIATGIYFKPEVTRFGVLKPSVDKVAHAIAKRDGVQILPTGDTALYQLGFSTQIPMKYVYLTSGSDRQINLGEHTLSFLHRTPKNFAYKDELTATLVQALRTLGKENITENERQNTKKLLRQITANGNCEADMTLPPLWIKKLIIELRKEIENE